MATRRAGLPAKVASVMGPWGFCLVMAALRWWWARGAPLGNDEAYYWDFSRDLALSYLDHPPAVAWVAWLARALGLGGGLAARAWLPVVHGLAVVTMTRVARQIKGASLDRRELWWTVLVGQLVPAFSLEGVVLLPDGPLLLALALALFAALGILRSQTGAQRAAWFCGFGTAVGVAGLCKYHAAPLALGMGLGVLRLSKNKAAAMAGLAVAATFALVVMTPVWLWNSEHGWASLRFQSQHGFGSLSFAIAPAGRFAIGAVLLLTPSLVIAALRPAGFETGNLSLVPRWGLLALAGPLLGLAFGQQLLPHWIVPGFWLMVPVVGLQLARNSPESAARLPKALWRVSVGLALLLGVALPSLLAWAPILTHLEAALGSDAGLATELTLWEPLARALEQRPAGSLALPEHDGRWCPKPLWATPRWFWSAQLAYHLEGQPRVLSVDFHHLSYYHYRDQLEMFALCPVTVVADARHLDWELLAKAMVIRQQSNLTVPGHAATPVWVIEGNFRSAAELMALPVPAATYR